MPENILVTGASGFVGRHLSAALAAAGHTVYEHSSAISDITRELTGYSGVTHVFHLAARTFVPESWRDTPSFYAVNVQGTVNVMEFCRKHSASVTLLSSYVYGTPQQLPIDEDHPLVAVNPYAHTKILAEEVVRFYASQFRLQVGIVRPFNLYGRGQDSRFLIPQLIHAAFDQETPVIEVADLVPRRDYLHINDLIRLLLRMMSAGAAGTYNAGSGSSISVEEIALMVREYSGTGKRILSRNEHRPSEILDVVANTNRAKDRFGWEPCISIRDGIRELMDEERARVAIESAGLPDA